MHLKLRRPRDRHSLPLLNDLRVWCLHINLYRPRNRRQRSKPVRRTHLQTLFRHSQLAHLTHQHLLEAHTRQLDTNSLHSQQFLNPPMEDISHHSTIQLRRLHAISQALPQFLQPLIEATSRTGMTRLTLDLQNRLHVAVLQDLAPAR